jgi:hypothetical protein
VDEKRPRRLHENAGAIDRGRQTHPLGVGVVRTAAVQAVSLDGVGHRIETDVQMST